MSVSTRVSAATTGHRNPLQSQSQAIAQGIRAGNINVSGGSGAVAMAMSDSNAEAIRQHEKLMRMHDI